MTVVSLFLWIVLLSKPLMYRAGFSGYIGGNLSSSWTFNVTIFMNPFIGGILYVADYERNVIILEIIKIGSLPKLIKLKYNKYDTKSDLKVLCGCDPCDDELVNFYFKSSAGSNTLTCNNFRYFTFLKTNNKDRGSVHLWMTEKYKQRTVVKDRIFMELLAPHVGCLDSFYHNGLQYYFKSSYSIFRNFCPRKCTRNICNEGKCRALQPYGPLCDCSSTARNGIHCNNSLKKFKRESKNSYEIKEDTPDIYFKLTWRKLAEENYCLLQFVHRDGRETLSIISKSHKSYLLKGINILSEIDGDGINFLTLSLRDNNLIIKVNNKIVEQRRGENTRIHVGFTETREQCDTFEGAYDFDFKENQMRLFKGDPTGITSPSLVNGIFIFSIIGTVILVTTLFSVLIVALKCCRRKNLRKKTELNENIYDSSLKKGKFELQCHDDEYDSIDQTKIYKKPGVIIPRVANKEQCYAQMLPQLPSRNC